MKQSMIKLDKSIFDDFFNGTQTTPITYAELMLKLVQQDGERFQTFIMATSTKTNMNKGCIKRKSKSCPEGEYANPYHDTDIQKVSIIMGNLNLRYEHLVNAKRKRFGLPETFVSEQNWHKNAMDEINGMLVQNQINPNTKRYLKHQVLRTNKIGYRFGKGGAWLNPSEVAIVKQWEIPSQPPENQGLPSGEEIYIRTVECPNILMIKFNGKIYSISDAQ